MKLIHGIDLVKYTRFLSLSLPELKKYASKIMHLKEIIHFDSLEGLEKVKYLASILACKECIFKALGTSYSYKDIYILKTENGRKIYINNTEKNNLILSLSYEQDYLIASLVGFVNE
ncbi:4'-phosphopantetheinyl transferase superfamily protein [Ureaplasma canigenitalium]|uniref:4'-phosphopantetheinyl transferase superfamily protein n=1 Tax=Ureaplasma canigenitalium TaxID=42092 RepID=UPI0004E20DE9|nr:4'-phosphopantetheinyl transferase superfamily protein [Ureaplasma canigenitalium]